jgi:hypothetical protein
VLTSTDDKNLSDVTLSTTNNCRQLTVSSVEALSVRSGVRLVSSIISHCVQELL